MSTSAGFPRHRSAAAAALALLLALGAANAPARDDARTHALPADVRAFLDRRASCDHWRSEEPYDRSRAAQIERNACRFCRGTDAHLSALRAKYARDRRVIGRLQELDAAVEPRDEDALGACAAVADARRRPAPPLVKRLPAACAKTLSIEQPGWRLLQPTADVAAWARGQGLNAVLARGDFDANGSHDFAALVVTEGAPRLLFCLNPSRGSPALVVVREPHCNDLVFTKRAHSKLYNFETGRHERIARDGASVGCFEKAGSTYVITPSGGLRAIQDSD